MFDKRIERQTLSLVDDVRKLVSGFGRAARRRTVFEVDVVRERPLSEQWSNEIGLAGLAEESFFAGNFAISASIDTGSVPNFVSV